MSEHAMSHWQPIKTVVIDGMIALVYDPEHGVIIAELSEGEWIRDSQYIFQRAVVHPTHWMPLPDPPSKAEGRD